MQACLFAFTDVVSVVRADLDPTLKSVSVAASLLYWSRPARQANACPTPAGRILIRLVEAMHGLARV
jgi:hypothetical protein